MIILAIQSTYTDIEIALYNTSLMQFVGHTSIAKDKTFTLLSVINVLLIDTQLTIHDISWCFVNRGPAPFTTLRTIIATANGLQAALRIPLIGMSGLELLSKEYNIQQKKSALVLNAFAGDFYFYINNDCQGVCSAEEMKATLQKHEIYTIIGNGSSLLQSIFPQEKSWCCVDPKKGTCSLDTLITYGYQQAIAKTDSQKYISPLYFKEVTIFQ